MGHPDGAHTHGSGGGEAAVAILMLFAVAAVAGPVLAAVGELVHIRLIIAAVIGGLGAVGLVALLAWRWRRTLAGAARAMPPRTEVVRAAQPLPKAQRPRELPTGLRGQTPGELHLHFHGVTAEDVAAILRDGHTVNPGSGPRVTPAWPIQE
jgi:hypothetical protein